ncbi:MAG: hypothetical protein ABJD07_16180, partial [Gemmatimonadaceae bacterium]
MQRPVARVTPYELILEPLEASAFPAIRDEAERRGTDARRRDQFLMLGSVGGTLQDIAADDAPAEAIDEYAELVFQGYQFWTFGRRLYVLDGEVTDELLAPELSMAGWQLAAPPACYLQFPHQRIWARLSAEAPFEPVDGCFVFVDETEPAPESGAHLRALLLLGVRDDRPGLSLVSYRTDLHPSSAPAHAEKPWRADGVAFANVIPGGERMRYRTITTTSELEALVLRVLWYLDTSSRALSAQPSTGAPGETHLPHTLVRRV